MANASHQGYRARQRSLLYWRDATLPTWLQSCQQGGAIMSCLVMVQAYAGQGRAWFDQLQQAQQDLLAAQVLSSTCLPALSCAGAVSRRFRTCRTSRSGSCKQAQLVCAVMRCKHAFWFNYSGGSRAKYVQSVTLSVIMQLYASISTSTI